MKKLICTLGGAVALMALGTPCSAARQISTPDATWTYEEIVAFCDYFDLSTADSLTLMSLADPISVDPCAGNPGGWP